MTMPYNNLALFRKRTCPPRAGAQPGYPAGQPRWGGRVPSLNSTQRLPGPMANEKCQMIYGKFASLATWADFNSGQTRLSVLLARDDDSFSRRIQLIGDPTPFDPTRERRRQRVVEIKHGGQGPERHVGQPALAPR